MARYQLPRGVSSRSSAKQNNLYRFPLRPGHNFSHIVVYENNSVHIVRKTQGLNTYFCTHFIIKKSLIYGILAGPSTRRVWKTDFRGVIGYNLGFWGY